MQYNKAKRYGAAAEARIITEMINYPEHKEKNMENEMQLNAVTEQSNARFGDMDMISTEELMLRINDEDAKVAAAVRLTIPKAATVAERAANGIAAGGRLIYVGAGTSGRLGVLDASECPPTFGVDYETVQGHIAGGYDALIKAAEGAEDNGEAGAELIDSLNVGENDTVVGISASGGARYVIAAVKRAKEKGAFTAAVTSNANTRLGQAADVELAAITGPEAVAGSTRMKCGTAQKLILNMISTCAMVRLGRVKGGLMTDMVATNEKLRQRAVGIVMRAANVDEERARMALEKSNMETGAAIRLIERGEI